MKMLRHPSDNIWSGEALAPEGKDSAVRQMSDGAAIVRIAEEDLIRGVAVPTRVAATSIAT